MNNSQNEFRYGQFPMSNSALDFYVDSAIKSKKSDGMIDGADSYSVSIVDSIIQAIVAEDVSFDVNNKHVVFTLYRMIRDCGHDADGKYSDVARDAMRVICRRCGFAENALELQDVQPVSKWQRFKNRISGMFGFGDKKTDDAESRIDVLIRARDEQKSKEKQKAAVVPVTATHKVENNQRMPQNTPSGEQPSEKNKPANVMSNKTTYKWGKSNLAASVIGFVAIGGVALFGGKSNASDGATTDNNNETKTFNIVHASDTTHYTDTTTYNLADVFGGQKSVGMNVVDKYKHMDVDTTATVKKVATDSISVALTVASRSALDVLLGRAKAQKLCDDVRTQIELGIFAAPDGMSVERIAHAMEMSRIYEGQSIILDALHSNEKLTPAQQAAFEDHIAQIGDMGKGIQKRMARTQKLSSHSHYNKSKKTLRASHAKNIKHLRDLKKRSHQR